MSWSQEDGRVEVAVGGLMISSHGILLKMGCFTFVPRVQKTGS